MKSKMLSATGANSQTPKVGASFHALSVTHYGQAIFPVNEHCFETGSALKQSKSRELYSPATAQSHRLNTWFSGIPWIALSCFLSLRIIVQKEAQCCDNADKAMARRVSTRQNTNGNTTEKDKKKKVFPLRSRIW